MCPLRTGLPLSAILAVLMLSSGPGRFKASEESDTPVPVETLVASFDVNATAVAFSPDGKRLAAAAGKSIRLFSVKGDKQTRTFDGHQLEVGALAFSPDGKTLGSVACSTDRPGPAEVKLWNLADGKLLLDVAEKEHRSDGDGANPHPFASFSRDGSLFVYPGKNRTLILWDVEKKQPREVIDVTLIPSAVAFSPDGKTMAFGDNTGEFHGGLWFRPLDDKPTLRTGPRHLLFSGILAIEYTRGGKEILIGHNGRFQAVYRLPATSDPDLKDESRGLLFRWPALSDQAVGGRIEALAFSPGGRLVAVRTGETAEVWNTETKKQVAAFSEAAGPLAFSSDGSLLATGRKNGSLAVVTMKPDE